MCLFFDYFFFFVEVRNREFEKVTDSAQTNRSVCYYFIFELVLIISVASCKVNQRCASIAVLKK